MTTNGTTELGAPPAAIDSRPPVLERPHAAPGLSASPKTRVIVPGLRGRSGVIGPAIYCRASPCERGAWGCALDDAGVGTGLRVPIATCACGAGVLGRRFC